MIEKQDFIEKLKSALTERGISHADMQPYMERFDKFYDRMISEPGTGADALADIDGIADNIKAQIEERREAMDELAEQTLTMDTVKSETAPAPVTADEPATAEMPAAEDDSYLYDDEYELVEDYEADPIITEAVLNGEIAAHGEDGTGRLPDYVEREPVPNPKIFWILFAVSFPITAPLALVGLGIFAAMWGVVVAVMVAAMTALIAIAGCGVLVSLVGIIYGAAQMFTSVPVGLYEIGLGVAAAGCAMLVCILLYNLAVRLCPVIMKLILKLFKFVLSKLRDLFDHLRRECAKL